MRTRRLGSIILRAWSHVRLDVRIWLTVGLLIAALVDVAYERAWVLALLPPAAWALVGLILLCRHLLRLPSLREDYSRAPNVMALLAGAFMFLPVTSLAQASLYPARFRCHRAEYEAVVTAVEQGRPVATSVEYIVEPGFPARVAFPWPGGIIDNWCGAVYDPTSMVAQVNGLRPFTPEWRAHPATGLFGGDLVSCRTLDGPHHLCCFT